MIKIAYNFLIISAFFSLASFSFVIGEKNEKIIQKNLHQMLEAWNERRMQDFSNFYTENATFITIFGDKFSGRTAIAERHIRLHEQKNILKYDDIKLKLLGLSMVEASILWSIIDKESQRIITSGRWTQLFVRSEDNWLIAFAQNTAINAKL